MPKDVSNSEILKVVSFIKDRVVSLEEKIDLLETEMMKMRDDIRAIDAKVSGIWNVLDMHSDRIKKLEADMQRLKTSA